METLKPYLTFLIALAIGCSGDSMSPVDAAAADTLPDAGADTSPDASPDTSLECSFDIDCPTGRCTMAMCSCPAASEVPSPGEWVRATGAPLLVPGQVHADGTNYLIADPTALFDETGAWRVWYAASRGTCFSCENDAVIEHARSPDGRSWTVQETVALGATEVGWDRIRTETPDVILDPAAVPERRYVLAYAGADVMIGLGFPNYNIGVAFSSDGMEFTRVSAADSPHDQSGLVLRETDVFSPGDSVTGGVIADPSLVLVDGVYHIWFSSFGCTDGDTCADIVIINGEAAFGVSHATSADAIHWVPDPNNPVLVGAEQPSVLWNPSDCRFEMWFARDEDDELAGIPSTFNSTIGTWYATSTDGTNWIVEPERDFVWNIAEPGEQLGLLTGADVALRGNDRVLFYVGLGTDRVPPDSFLPVRPEVDPAGFVSGTFGLGIATQ